MRKKKVTIMPTEQTMITVNESRIGSFGELPYLNEKTNQPLMRPRKLENTKFEFILNDNTRIVFRLGNQLVQFEVVSKDVNNGTMDEV